MRSPLRNRDVLQVIRILRTKSEGSLLINLAIGLVLAAILVQAILPETVTLAKTKAAAKVAKEMGKIIDASRWYYIDNQAWPSTVSALVTAGYMPTGWNGNNPFGNPYTITSTATTLSLSSLVPTKVQNVVTSYLPQSKTNGTGTVTATTLVPGLEEDRSNLLARSGTDIERSMGDSLNMNNHRITNLGNPIDPNDALSVSAGDAYYLQKAGGTMTGTLSTPHLIADRVYDSNDPTYFEDPSGTSYVNKWNTYDVWIGARSKWLSDILTEQVDSSDWNCYQTAGTCCWSQGDVLFGAGQTYKTTANMWSYNPASGRSYYYYNASGLPCISSNVANANLTCCR